MILLVTSYLMSNNNSLSNVIVYASGPYSLDGTANAGGFQKQYASQFPLNFKTFPAKKPANTL